MRLLFSNRKMGGMVGGVQRAITTLMNGMVARGHEVSLLTWDQAGTEAFFPISPEISWHRLNLGDTATKASIRVRLRRAKAVRNVIRECKPQLIIGFRGGQFLVARLYSLGLGIPAIAAERGAPARFDHMPGGSRWRFIEFNGMRLAKKVVIQLEGYRSQYPGYLRDKLVVIPNPVLPAARFATPDRPDNNGRFRVLSVGRLSYNKNNESLILAFSALAEQFPSWDLMILGEGDERPKLESLVRETGFADRIRLPGAKADVSEWYQDSHLFCLPSRHEGFPNALAEAHAHGLPAVGFAGCTGVNELIDDGKTGLLVQGNGNVQGLSQALETLMSGHAERRMMGASGRRAMEVFSPDSVMDAWERLFENAIER